MNLKEALEQIKKPDTQAMVLCQKRWDSIAKPLHSLGIMEDYFIKIAGMIGSSDVVLNKKALVVMCADNGVVEEGVTQTGQEVTAIVSENFLKEQATASILCKSAGATIVPVDIGVAVDTNIMNRKVAYGTKNMAKGPAMTRAEVIKAIETGIHITEELVAKGYQILATGEMGIGNTTTSSAVASVLLEVPVEEVTGRGAGLTSSGLAKKIETIKKAIALNKPQKEDVIDVLAKVGGFDIAGLTGVFLGGAALGIPVVIDGFISAVSALCAVRLCPLVREYSLASHISKEPAAGLILEQLGLAAPLHCDMCLGEGTGAVVLFPILDMAAVIYQEMSTFVDIQVEEYKPLN